MKKQQGFGISAMPDKPKCLGQIVAPFKVIKLLKVI